VDADYLRWWVKKGPLPQPLITGAGGSPVLVGGNGIDYGSFSGGQLAVGAWLDPDGRCGVEARGFLLQERSTGGLFSPASTNPTLGFPFLNTGTGRPGFFNFATPGALAGSVFAASSTRLWGGEANALVTVARCETFSLLALGGFRYLDLREDLVSGGASAALPGARVAFGGRLFGPPAVTSNLDVFQTRTHFYGAQVGAQGGVCCGHLFATLTGKIGLGDNQSTVNIAGASSLSRGGVPVAVLPGSLFALPSNLGSRDHDSFSVVPELEVKVGYHVTRRVSAFVGYNFLYWTDVARPGNQLNQAVAATQVPTSVNFARGGAGLPPQPVFRSSDFWAQGVNFGVEVRF
jgi:hypothetical protein